MWPSHHIKTVEGTWADATLSTAELIDGTFLLVREDGVPLAWVVGLDERGERVPDSLIYATNLPHWLEYERTRWITTPEGIIVLGTYMLELDKKCVELRFLTVENARKRVTGEEAFTKQVGCGVIERNQVVGPPVSTVIENNIRTSAGVIEDESVIEVEIRWSDGFVERVPVIDGFYFVQRQGTQAAIYAVVPRFSDIHIESPAHP